jgi:hypothetical protein
VVVITVAGVISLSLNDSETFYLLYLLLRELSPLIVTPLADLKQLSKANLREAASNSKALAL